MPAAARTGRVADRATVSGRGSLWRLPAIRRLIVVSVLGFVSFFLTLASVPSWAAAGGVGTGFAGVVTTVMLAATVATQAVVPALVARLGTGRTLACGLVALGAPAPLYAAGSGLGLLLAVSAVRGTGFAVLTVVGAALAGTLAPAGRQGESIGLYGLTVAAPNLIGVPASIALTQAGDFRWVAVLAAAPVLAVPLAFSFGPATPVRPQPGAAGDVRSHRGAMLVVLAPSLVLLVVTLAGGGVVTFLPIARPSGLLATLALLALGGTAALARWGAGVLVDRLGARVLLPASLVTAAAGLAVVAAGLQPGWAAAALLLVGSAVFGVGYGGVQNLTLVLAFDRAGPRRTSTASAVWNAAFDAGTGIGALAVGAVAATGLGLRWTFAATAGAIALALPLALDGAGGPAAAPE